MENHKIIEVYLEFKEQLEDSRNYFCFNTSNGRRMIVKIIDRKKCIAIDKNFRACSFMDEKLNSFYDSPLDLIESYYCNGDVRIDDLLVTFDKTEAMAYLQGKSEEQK